MRARRRLTPSRRGAALALAATCALVSGVDAQLLPADPQVSPDGRLVAYVVHGIDESTGEPYSNLVIRDAVLGRRERITEGVRIDRTPRFSPDSRSVAWVTFVDGFWELRVRTLDQGRQRELAVGSLPHGAPSWSPRGDHIAYTRMEVAPDDESGPIHVFTVPVAGGRPRRITREGFYAGGIELGARLSWAPDGGAILMTADPGGDEELYEIDVGTGVERIIAPRSGPDRDPVVSPDGTKVAYIGAYEESAATRLFVAYRAGASFPQLLSSRVQDPVRHPVWAPDGQGVFAVIERPGGDRLALFSLDASHRVIAENLSRSRELLLEAAHGAAPFTVSADSTDPRVATLIGRPDRPPEIAVGGTRTGDPVRSLDRFGSMPSSAIEVVDLTADETTIGVALLPRRHAEDPESPDPARDIVVDLRTDGAAGATRWDPARAALVAAGYVVVVPIERDGRATDGPALGAAALRSGVTVAGVRVFRLGDRPDDPGVTGVVPREVDPDGPFDAALDWGPAALERIGARIEATLEWLRDR
ncbi:MAG: hypothetical protein R3195_04690 [Gemmatimonadota bacterium]|nr:hypothetical protein [Gemmatimonadota bacterium]